MTINDLLTTSTATANSASTNDENDFYDEDAAIFEIMDCPSRVDEAKMVLFSKDFSNLQLTFSSPAMCENAM